MQQPSNNLTATDIESLGDIAVDSVLNALQSEHQDKIQRLFDREQILRVSAQESYLSRELKHAHNATVDDDEFDRRSDAIIAEITNLTEISNQRLDTIAPSTHWSRLSNEETLVAVYRDCFISLRHLYLPTIIDGSDMCPQTCPTCDIFARSNHNPLRQPGEHSADQCFCHEYPQPTSFDAIISHMKALSWHCEHHNFMWRLILETALLVAQRGGPVSPHVLSILRLGSKDQFASLPRSL